MEAMSRAPIKKGIMKFLGQMKVLEEAALIHVTSIAEADCVRALGFHAPVAVIPNATNIERPNGIAGSSSSRIIYLGRIHPIKGLENLIAACADLGKREWELVIVGPLDSAYARKFKLEAEKCLGSRVCFMGEVTGTKKRELLAGSRVSVLPSRSENFGMAVVEALGCGIPVIATQGTPWKEVVSRDCGWWIPFGKEPLHQALEKALDSSPACIEEMGARGLDWVEEEFSWTSVAKRMLESYKWVVNNQSGPKPDWIMIEGEL